MGEVDDAEPVALRIGEHDVFAAARRRNELRTTRKCDTRTLLAIVANMFQITGEDLCSRGKSSQLVDAKEVLILSGHRLGASLAEMSDLIGINGSTATRRHDAAKRRLT